MTNSHSRSARFAAAFLVLALPAAAAAPQAVKGKAETPANSIANPASPATIGQIKPAAPKAAAPASAAGESAPAAIVPTPPPPSDSVQSQPLAVPQGQLVGLLDSGNGGFGRDLWAGSDRLLIETLLPRLPAAQGSPAMTDLERRLLLTRADPPQGQSRQVSLTASRLDRALAIGQFGTIEPLAQQAQPEIARPEVLGPRVDALLYQGTDKDACVLAERARGRSAEASWTKRLAYCDALSGKVAEARMSVDVLGDTGDADPAFSTLMGRILDKTKLATVSPDNPSAVHFALLRQTTGAINDASLDRASPAFLVAWSGFEKAPMAQRVAAAERAVSSGALPATALLKLYRAMPMKPQRLSAVYNTKKLLSGVDGAAYAVQRLAISTNEVERGHLITAALRSARDRGVLPGVVAALRADVSNVTANDSLIEIAPMLGAAEALGGSGNTARRWLDLARSKGVAGSEPALALRSLLSARGLHGDIDWTPDQFLQRLRGAKPADQSRVSYEWAVLRPLGLQQTSALFLARLEAPLSGVGAVPSLAVLEGLQDASDNGRVGETAIYALLALGPAGPRGAQPLALAAAVRALARVGLDGDARAIATEALAWRMP